MSATSFLSNHKTDLAALILAAAALTLTACASEDVVADGTTSQLPTGTTLTAEQAADLSVTDGERAYPMPDGTQVLVRARQTLPADVANDVDRRATETLVDMSVEGAEGAADAASALAASVSTDTGKYVAVIFEDLGTMCGTLDEATTTWTTNVPLPGDCTEFETYEAAWESVDAYVAEGMGGPETWYVVSKH